ncbi:1-aminocyclopropane-1-carboxylate deaminase/D-cysteine desulfhydrase [Brumimicrobium mesophilum]|uniref:1-aminocyclopropane-1-carboxylate deaminase/D-cysteine desulfhydrase n=1 Tax=Brumimicrobium mesophilum TaxID=392717 RepID=UPI000D1401F1|nr:pyridoxal-phosphate dependent enzyme [Brumimicrobium mesophilum]
MLDTSNSIIEKVRLPIGKGEPFSFDIKRDDLIDSVISGNKWRKLKYNLLEAAERKNEGLITFGGPFSNHLVATAKAAKESSLKSIGIVRGDELSFNSNETLKACHSFGMDLVFISRSDYKEKDEPYFIKQLHSDYPNFFLVPEGGRSYYGVIGCQELMSETLNDYDHIYLSGGTGTTGAGILLGSSEKSVVNVVSALKGSFLQKDIEGLLLSALNDQSFVDLFMERLKVHNSSHFGGYAKVNDELFEYINWIYSILNIKLDPIYTAKAFYQMHKDFKEGIISPEQKVLFIHTGGLQGALSWKNKIDYCK